MTIAKGIGGGFPVGACLATADAAKGLTVGVHGTTFGGNPLAMAVGNAVLDVVLAPGFIERVARLGLFARQRLAELKDRHPDVIEEVRGEGLMIGLKLKFPPQDFAAAARGASSADDSRPATTSCASCRRSSSPKKSSPKACGGSTRPAPTLEAALGARQERRRRMSRLRPMARAGAISSTSRPAGASCARILDASPAMKAARVKGEPPQRGRSRARRWR